MYLLGLETWFGWLRELTVLPDGELNYQPPWVVHNPLP